VLGLARVYGKKGQPDEAARVLAGIGKQFAGDEVLMRAKAAEGLIYQQNGQAEKAGAAARELAEILKQAGQLPSVQTSIDAAGLLLTGGFKEAGVALLQSVVKNNHDNPDLMAKVQQAFDVAGLHEEGTHLVARSKREATEQMNEGVLLARGGKLSEAVAAMRRAKAAMPSNVRVLLNCAHVMILSLQKQSMDPAVFREAQQTLLRANMLAPGEERFSRLMRELEALKAAYG
jgi:tetratricopeptide (TPR) repeat protein